MVIVCEEEQDVSNAALVHLLLAPPVSTHPVDPVEAVEAVDSVDPVEVVEAVEAVDSVDSVDSVPGQPRHRGQGLPPFVSCLVSCLVSGLSQRAMVARDLMGRHSCWQTFG